MSLKDEKVRLVSISKSFVTERGETLQVLRNLSCSFSDGEFVSVIGPSGGGKTTLLYLITGLLRPTSGEILVSGAKIAGPGSDRGMVFQQDAILMWRTVRRNVEYGLELAGVRKQERRKIAEKYIGMVGLSGFEEFYPKELSGGMKKRCHIAAVYANNPAVLLMDEPFGSVDYPTKVNLQAKLQEIWLVEPKLTLFVTHDLEEALFLSDRIIAIAGGTIAKDFRVPFDRPRTDALRMSAQFQHEKSELWRFLQPEAPIGKDDRRQSSD